MVKQSNSTIGYIRVSTSRQDADNQKLSILEYARKHSIKVDDFIKVEKSSRKSQKDRKIDQLLDKLKRGDTLLLSELSRLGRSISEIISLIDQLYNNGIRVISLKEKLDINGKRDLQSKITVTLFGLMAEIERDLISERTKEGLAAARAKGKLLGRPVGSKGKSLLDGKESIILDELKFKVSKSAIARKMGVSRGSLINFIKTRGI